jgi:hypothetical protein
VYTEQITVYVKIWMWCKFWLCCYLLYAGTL